MLNDLPRRVVATDCGWMNNNGQGWVDALARGEYRAAPPVFEVIAPTQWAGRQRLFMLLIEQAFGLRFGFSCSLNFCCNKPSPAGCILSAMILIIAARLMQRNVGAYQHLLPCCRRNVTGDCCYGTSLAHPEQYRL